MLLAGLLVIALAGIAVQGSPISKAKACTLNIQTETDPYYEPLILGMMTKKKKTSYHFVYPKVQDHQGILTLANGHRLLLSCPLSSKGNSQETSGVEEAYALCKNGALTINGTEFNNKTSSCKMSYAYSWLNITDTVCGSKDNSGIIVQLGFKLESLDNLFMPVAYSCFNISQAKTLWSQHQLMGASIDGRVRGGGSRSFSAGPSTLWPNVYPSDCYPQKDQIKTFNTILGDGAADKYLTGENFLNRGHLAPHADFILNTQRLMTYYYINCAPQWYNFNAGNWEVIENFTRSLAFDVSTTLNVWTGTYGILELENMSGKLTKMYLDAKNDLIPVPLVYWKLVTNPKTKACTVAIGYNNPYLTTAPEPLCRQVEPYGWPTLTSNFSHGYSYYCSYHSFKKVVDYVPNIACNKLFEFPK